MTLRYNPPVMYIAQSRKFDLNPEHVAQVVYTFITMARKSLDRLFMSAHVLRFIIHTYIKIVYRNLIIDWKYKYT